MAIDRIDTLAVMAARTKRVEARYVQHLARLVRELVDTEFDKNGTKAAKAIGISQGHVSQLARGIHGTRGPGLPALIALRAYMGKSIDELLGLPPLPQDALTQRIREVLIEESAKLGDSSVPPPPLPTNVRRLPRKEP